MMLPNPLERRVAKMRDCSFIYELTQDGYCKDNGRPSVDPVLSFRRQLRGYLFAISSDRRLGKEVQP
jgi:transposase